MKYKQFNDIELSTLGMGNMLLLLLLLMMPLLLGVDLALFKSQKL